MIVRRLAPPEVPLLLPMAREHCEHRAVALDEAWFVRYVRLVLSQPGGLVLGLFDGRALVGSAAGFISKDLFSAAPTLWGLWWYVNPESRGGAAAMRLVRALFREAAAAGATAVEMAIYADSRGVGRAYRRMGLVTEKLSFAGDLCHRR